MSSSTSLPEILFLVFVHLATEGVEYSFNNILFAQIDGTSMGRPLSPIEAIFFSWKAFESCQKPSMHLRYVDDTFLFLLSLRRRALSTLTLITSIRPFLFNRKEESLYALLFLGVPVVTNDGSYISSVYLRTTFTLFLYTNSNSFILKSCTINLIFTLVHCDLMIC